VSLRWGKSTKATIAYARVVLEVKEFDSAQLDQGGWTTPLDWLREWGQQVDWIGLRSLDSTQLDQGGRRTRLDWLEEQRLNLIGLRSLDLAQLAQGVESNGGRTGC
jgi:hypothetical protein